MNKPFEASKTTARDQPALPPNASPTDLEKLETSISRSVGNFCALLTSVSRTIFLTQAAILF
jgi:hypothetical protein